MATTHETNLILPKGGTVSWFSEIASILLLLLVSFDMHERCVQRLEKNIHIQRLHSDKQASCSESISNTFNIRLNVLWNTGEGEAKLSMHGIEIGDGFTLSNNRVTGDG